MTPTKRVSPDDIDHFSASAIGKYLRCPYQYYRSYLELEEVQVPFKKAKARILGKSYHEGLETHYKGGDFESGFLRSLDETHHRYLRKTRKKELEEGLDKMEEQGKKMFSGYQATLEKEYGEDFKPAMVEVGIQAVIQDPVSKKKSRVPYLGIIDLVLENHILIDHKTVSRYFREPEEGLLRQASIYAMLYRAHTGSRPHGFFISMHNKGSGRWRRLDIPVDNHTQHNQFEILQEAADGIFGGNFEPKLGDHCKWCEFYSRFYNNYCLYNG